MQSSVWATLLRQIPTERHDQLMLTTLGGTEIAIQGILRIDHEFLAIKGRLAGSQDAGRVFFLPYCQIDYLGFQRALKDSEFHELFGSLDIPAPPAAASPPVSLPPSAQPAPAETLSPAAATDSGLHRVTPLKSAVLERFRSRGSTAPGTTGRPSGGG